jgi:hypothetical protein
MAPDRDTLHDNGAMHWVRKYTAVVVAVVVTGGSCTVFRQCRDEGAPLIGIQTTAAAKVVSDANAKEHGEMIEAIVAVDEKRAADRKELMRQQADTDEAVMETLQAVSKKRADKLRAKRKAKKNLKP